MPTTLIESREPVAPTESEAEVAREASRRLLQLGEGQTPRLHVGDDEGSSEDLAIPASALRLLVRILEEMAQGNAVAVVPVPTELTTQQAADLLNVSRPYLVKLLDEGKIPHRMVGKYHRVRLDDLLAYKRKDDAVRAKIADQLAAEAQELGLGY